MRSVLAMIVLSFVADTTVAQDVGLDARVGELAREFRYGQAAAEIEAWLQDDEPRDGAAVLRAWELLVTMHVSAGDVPDAERAATILYELDPGRSLPAEDAVPPQIRRVLADARRAAQGPPRELHVSLRSDDRQLHVTARAPTGRRRDFDRAAITIDTGAGFETHDVPVGPEIRLSLPRGDARVVRYHVRVVTPSGHVVARAGTPDGPLAWSEGVSLDRPGAEPSSGSTLGWWIAGGVALAAALTIVVIALGSASSDEPTIIDPIVVP